MEWLEVHWTMERDQAHHACFLAGGKSLQCVGCSVTPLLVMPRQWVVPCVLHCTMAIGCLPQDFIRKESEGLSAADKIHLEGHHGDHKTACSIFDFRSLDGEESRALFDAWPVLARRLCIPTTARKYGAVVAMGLLLSDCIGRLKRGTLCVTPLPRSSASDVARAQRQTTWFFWSGIVTVCWRVFADGG